jgi:hypothetical protein
LVGVVQGLSHHAGLGTPLIIYKVCIFELPHDLCASHILPWLRERLRLKKFNRWRRSGNRRRPLFAGLTRFLRNPESYVLNHPLTFPQGVSKRRLPLLVQNCNIQPTSLEEYFAVFFRLHNLPNQIDCTEKSVNALASGAWPWRELS